MGSKRQETPNRPTAIKSRINRKRPEKQTAAKRYGATSKGTSRKTISRKRSQQTPAGVLLAARSEYRRHVLLDACNISHTNTRLPRFRTERLAKAIQFFVQRGHAVHAVFPRFHLYTGQWDSIDRLNGLYRKNYIVPTPCKEFPNRKSQVYDDRILMAIAARFNCAVVSNDMFRDVAAEHPEWNRAANTLRIPFSWDGSENFSIPREGYTILDE